MKDSWKTKEPFPDVYINLEKEKLPAKSISLSGQLNFCMPHRNFEHEINKYVKVLFIHIRKW